MKQTDIALLLADAAEDVEIGIAPVDAVVRGGRRRRARRWAVVAATAVVLAGSTGATLAVTGLPGRNTADEASRGASVEERHVYEPWITHIAVGKYEGKGWGVGIKVWGPPRNRAEAVKQVKALAEWGLVPAGTGSPSDLIGKTSYYVTSHYDQQGIRTVTWDTVAMPHLKGADLRAFPAPLTADSGPSRLVVGQVATSAKQVTCHWKDGRSTVGNLLPDNTPNDLTQAQIKSVYGFPGANWFACVAPGDTTYKSAEVTK
ncbi:hypothetical protein [Streptomyces sp. L2]|uniref:hypothetical protein n=1 Tax=Streptomyces sp. L2 TaxID=2162665 RepID=UPI001F507471|nr:hypothetical protein [Streptomyces sp. L2]